jgi:hypothetical protein
MLTGAAAPGSDHAYQFWILGENKDPKSAGYLAGGQTSGARLLNSYAGSDAVGVTRERAGGADQPSMSPLASLSLG